LEDQDAVADVDEKRTSLHARSVEELVGVGAVVITRLAVPVVVGEKVTEDASTESLEACDCNPEIWVETLVFSHLLRKDCRSDSRRLKFGTWWSIE
jgi:hypothetical protein